MGANGHQKGARWERAVAAYLRDHGFPDAERVGNTGDHDDRGLDIAGVAPWGIDCKDRAKWEVPAWWRKCQSRARQQDLSPVLVVKRARKPTGEALVVCHITTLFGAPEMIGSTRLRRWLTEGTPRVRGAGKAWADSACSGEWGRWPAHADFAEGVIGVRFDDWCEEVA